MPVLFVLLSGCASIPDAVRHLDADTPFVELTDTPFFPQERYQCGPAALATALTKSGADVSLQELVKKVYLPGKTGSLQIELLAATRTSGRMPYVIDGTLSALFDEVSAGRPAIVLQNLGVAAIPRWHYAAVVGIDPARDEIILRSGRDKRRITAINTFLRTWRRGDFWAMVVLRPDEIPANVDQTRYFESIAALEQADRVVEASIAWRTALETWPEHPVAQFGLANVRHASDDLAGAEALYRILLAKNDGLTVARNNLAMTLAKQHRFDEALGEIELALGSTQDAALMAELRRTRESVLQLMRVAD